MCVVYILFCRKANFEIIEPCIGFQWNVCVSVYVSYFTMSTSLNQTVTDITNYFMILMKINFYSAFTALKSTTHLLFTFIKNN